MAIRSAVLGLVLRTSHTVESKSTVISATLGAAPTDHARTNPSSAALSSWRTCPNVNDLKNVHSVDGANGANGSTPAAEPDPSRRASSIQHPPTSTDATSVSTFAPAPAPADPPGRTVSSINASKPSLDITVPASNNPPSATKDPSSNTAPNPSIPPATLLTGSASSHGQNA